MTHGEVLVRPFVTCRAPGVEHVIMMQGDEAWLCWKHPDGQWVTECRVTGPGLSWHDDDGDHDEVGAAQGAGDAALRAAAQDLCSALRSSWVERVSIARELGLYRDADVRGHEVEKRWFTLARERNQIDELERLVGNASPEQGDDDA